MKNNYISRLTNEELVDLINFLINKAYENDWNGKRPAIEGNINYITTSLSESGKTLIGAKRIVGEYAVFDIGEFLVDDFSVALLVWGKPYISLDKELHEYLACRFGQNYIEDFYEHEQERITKENIRLTLLAGNSRK